MRFHTEDDGPVPRLPRPAEIVAAFGQRVAVLADPPDVWRLYGSEGVNDVTTAVEVCYDDGVGGFEARVRTVTTAPIRTHDIDQSNQLCHTLANHCVNLRRFEPPVGVLAAADEMMARSFRISDAVRASAEHAAELTLDGRVLAAVARSHLGHTALAVTLAEAGQIVVAVVPDDLAGAVALVHTDAADEPWPPPGFPLLDQD